MAQQPSTAKEYHKFGCYKSEWWERSGNDIDGNLKYTLVDTDENYRPFYFLREEGEKVYVLTLDNEIFLSSRYPEESFNTEITSDRYGEFLRYDFSLTAGETIDVPVTLYDLSELAQVSVVEEEPVQVGGIPRRAFSLRGMGAFHPYPIVEGIGPTKYGDLAVFTTSFTTGSPGRGVVMQGGELARVYDPAGNVIYGTPRGTTTTYHPIIEEGKVWEYWAPYSNSPYGSSSDGVMYRFYKFDGTANVNGKEYHKFGCFKTEYWERSGNDYDGNLEYTLVRTDRSYCPFYLFREEGKKVYVLTLDDHIFISTSNPEETFETEVTSDRYGEFLRYDFSLEDGETFNVPLGYDYVGELYPTTIVEEAPVSVDGTARSAFSLQGEMAFYPAPIVEGLGATKYGDLAMFATIFMAGKPESDSDRNRVAWQQDGGIERVYSPDGRIIYGNPRGKTWTTRLIDENKVWNYILNVMNIPEEKVHQYRFQMAFDGTTAIGDKTYHVLKTKNVVGYKYNDEQESMVPVEEVDGKAEFYLREEQGRIYIYDRSHGSQAFSSHYEPALGESNEILLYDFNLEPGDSYESYGGFGQQAKLTVDKIEVVSDGSNKWRKISMTGSNGNVGDLDMEYHLAAVDGIGFLSEYMGNSLVYFNNATFTGPYHGEDPEYLPYPGYGDLYLVNVTDREGNIVVSPKVFETNSVESVTADRMTLLSANGIVTAVSESGSEVRMTVYGIDGTVRAEVTGTGEATVNVSALGRGIYTVRATDGDALRVIKIRG